MADLAKKNTEELPSARFTAMVIKEYQVASGTTSTTPEMKRRIQNYFVKIDMILNEAETKRLSKSEQFRDPLAFSWKNVNMPKLATEVMALASLGLDPLTNNHVHPIPFKNSRTNNFDFSFIRGYKGMELVAQKFALTPPKNVICELVYSTDVFDMVKKDRENKVESYTFKIVKPFERGEIVGGFIYKEFEDETMNSIEVMSIANILKRKPKHASAEFWGGEKDIWENGKKAGKEKIEGWFEEMCLKTLKRHAWNSFTLDGSKVNDSYEKMLQIESTTETVADTTENQEVSVVIDISSLNEGKKPIATDVTTEKVEAKPIEVSNTDGSQAIEFPAID